MWKGTEAHKPNSSYNKSFTSNENYKTNKSIMDLWNYFDQVSIVDNTNNCIILAYGQGRKGFFSEQNIITIIHFYHFTKCQCNNSSYTNKYGQAYLKTRNIWFEVHSVVKNELIVILNLYQSLPLNFKPLFYPFASHLKCNKIFYDHIFPFINFYHFYKVIWNIKVDTVLVFNMLSVYIKSLLQI